MMAYKKVLPYAIAKNALLLITKSLAADYPDIRFNLVSPVSMTGAAEVLKKSRPVPPRKVAEEIYKIMLGSRSGMNRMIK
jgi:NAD(P)-dependent dehydrogenase (short-subunit alcohol dehydrogenase family)